MRPWDSDKNSLPELNSDSPQTLEEFIIAKMKHELELVENPTPEQLEKIIQRKVKNNLKFKGKTVHFRDFINEIAEDPNEIIDAKIVKKHVRLKVKNEEL